MINYNAALPPLPFMGKSSINVNNWMGEFKGNLTALARRMFANNEQGFFYDPNDLSTMFQDAAGTVPVTAVGQPVGLIRDKSGRNNHAYQTTSASRPILRKNAVTGANYLEFDGSDDFLLTNNIDFTATDKVSLFTGIRKLSDKQIGVVFELSSSFNANNGTFGIATPDSTTLQDLTSNSRGTTHSRLSYVRLTAPKSIVASAKLQISTDTNILRLNGAQVESTSNQGTGNYGNYPLYIGRRGGFLYPFNGHIYSLIGVGRLYTGSEIAAIEKELAKRTGVTLSV